MARHRPVEALQPAQVSPVWRARYLAARARAGLRLPVGALAFVTGATAGAASASLVLLLG